MFKRYRAQGHTIGHHGTSHHPGGALGGSRATLARSLRWLARRLRQAAYRLSLQAGRRPRVPVELEFHAEAGAPEGALYVNGELIGHLQGVTRL